MQSPTQVFIVTDDEQTFRKLSRVLEGGGDFAIIGFALSTSSEVPEPKNFDVKIVQTRLFSRFPHPPDASVPTLYLLSDGSPQTKELTGPSAVLPENASPAQIRAAAMALATGLQVAPMTSPPDENVPGA